MNNLLRTLTESHVQATPDLKLLLNTVRDVRRQGYDNKVSDPFYESLEGLLHDLRTVTMDNHDPEAFLKPVAKSDVPDYYDVISNPMDLQTMLKKVKAKQYKSKREFKDDLDLIWSNCFTYNATEDHHLRQCAMRLKRKAEGLLANITDRKDRVDPAIPPDFSSFPSSRHVARPKINGYSSYDRTKPPPTPQPYPSATPTPRPSSINGKRPAPSISAKKMNMDLPFGDTPALVRTPKGMASFRSLDMELDGLGEPGPSTLAHANCHSDHGLVERLRGYVVTREWESESEDEQSVGGRADNDPGIKRRLPNGIRNRPRKRARLTPPDSDEESAFKERYRNPTDLWWSAAQSVALFANGLPTLVQFPPTSSSRHPPQDKTESSTLKPAKRKRPRKRPQAPVAPPNTLLGIMNSNIKTLKRVRRTHAKFAALNLNAEDGGGAGMDEPLETADEDPMNEFVDERPWRTLVGLKGGDIESGIELGGERAVHCLRWTNGKVLEHAGFQGTSASALDVLTSVTSEFLLNVGRTLRFLCDKYARTMTAEEITLHTLFESGITKVQDLERYIKDDVVRHGSRLTDLEKKLINAYREATTVDVLDDDALFGPEEDEESETPFAMGLGGFSEAFDEDFLGLKELGIAAEFGLSSLSVPKRLLKGKRGGVTGATKAKPTEPPPPFPPPPPFVPITSKTMEDQIGLLKPFYQERFAMLAPSVAAPSPLISASDIPFIAPPLGIPVLGTGSMDMAGPTPGPMLLTLPDDPPPPSQTKVGPIGQIMRSVPTTGAVKKKSKAAATAAKDASVGPYSLPPGLLTLKPEEMSMEPLTMSFDTDGQGAVGDGDGGRRGAKGPGSLPSASGSSSAKKRAVELPPVIAASA